MHVDGYAQDMHVIVDLCQESTIHGRACIDSAAELAYYAKTSDAEAMMR